MKTIQSLYVLAEILALLGAMLVCILIGFYFLRSRNSALRIIIPVSMGILTLYRMSMAYTTQADLPMLDFVDRCRPNGTSHCLNGASFEQIQNEVDTNHLQLFFLFIIIPIFSWIVLQCALLLLMRNKLSKKPENSLQ